MPTSHLHAEKNRLLCAIPLHERQRLLLKCDTVVTQLDDVLFEACQPIHYIYFPLSGFISLVCYSSDQRSIELGLIGHEGMLGATVILGVTTAPAHAVVKASGEALRISVSQLQQLTRTCPKLLNTVNRYLYYFLIQLMQDATCGHYHDVEQRLARCILTAQDCTRSVQLRLTHHDFAGMLGVRRSGISIAAGSLQARHLIHYTRGLITILDRPGLERITCECHSTLKAEYSRQFPQTDNN